MAQRIQKIQKDHHQLVIRSPPRDNPAEFNVRLTNPIRLVPNKLYVIGLHNAILTSSWNSAPLGVAYTVNGVDVSIPSGHYTFIELKDVVKSDFAIEAVAPQGKVKITVPTGKTIVFKSIASKFGFAPDTTLATGENISPSIASVNPVNFISIHTNIIDVNSTRSNANIRPILRTALLPSCLAPYDYFDLCGSSDDYYVKCTRNEIVNIDIRVESNDGTIVQLDPSIPTLFTITIKEVDLI